MRLTCPNCGAEYDISDGMVPPAGRHVQCTACHTRWFVRGVPGTGLTEEQILRRLETWSPRPRPVAAPDPAPAGPRLVPEVARAPEPRATEPPPPPRAAPAKPADRPAVARPGPLAEPAAPPPPAAARPAPRLDLGEPALPVPIEPPPPSRSRFGRGLLLAVALFAIALGAYLYRDAIAIRVPAAAPTLQAYGERVDRLRGRVEERLAPFRRGGSTRPNS